MPEGHLYHRLARNLSEFSEGELAAWSPQGRFAEGAAQINGTRLEVAEAHGKHLLVRLAGGRTVHVHLGMRGKLLVGLCQVGARDRPRRPSPWGAGRWQIGQAPAQQASRTCSSPRSCHRVRPTPSVLGAAAAPG
jgi:hypothetical protein